MWIHLDKEDFAVNLDQCDCFFITNEVDEQEDKAWEVRAEAGNGAITLATCDTEEQARSIFLAVWETLQDKDEEHKGFWNMQAIIGLAQLASPEAWE